MKTREWLGKLLCRACIYFTAVTLILYTCGSLVSEAGHRWIPRLEMLYMLLLFCILFEGVNLTVRHSRLPGVLKLLLHYGACVLIFSVIFIVWGQSAVTSGGVFVILVTFTLFYAACALILFVIRYVRRDKENRTTSYESQFRNVKK